VNNYDINLVPLQQASLCLDCEGITAGHTTCLCCGSQALLNIARILNHKVFDARRPMFSSLRHRSGLTMESAFDHPLTTTQSEPRFAAHLGNRA
jgi:hypothetical protein